MRDRAPLVLIEQVLMLLVFALATVACLRAFVWADAESKESTARDQAMIQAQNAAETLKHYRGDFDAAVEQCGGIWDGETWVVLYDEQWNVTEDMHEYTLRAVSGESHSDYLGCADVAVFQGERPMAGLKVCWQEVGANG